MALDDMTSSEFAVSTHPSSASKRSSLQLYLKEWAFTLYTLWLFSESDFQTFILPTTAFGIFGAFSGQCLVHAGSNAPFKPALSDLLQRLPVVFLFNWANAFIFALSNQRLPESVMEDKINKPSRPIAAGRISPESTRRLMQVAVPGVLLLGGQLGVLRETALLDVFFWLYNDLRGCDELALRDPIITVGFALHHAGSLQLAARDVVLAPKAWSWIAVVSAVILSTMQIQDLKDQAGDRARARRTAPLVFGDGASRWMIATLVPVWAGVCAWTWRLSVFTAALPVAMACLISYRVVKRREFQDDKTSWKMWCGWLALLFSLPTVARLEELVIDIL